MGNSISLNVWCRKKRHMIKVKIETEKETEDEYLSSNEKKSARGGVKSSKQMKNSSN